MRIFIRAGFLASVCLAALASAVSARTFNIPSGDLETALNIYTAQTGVSLTVSDNAVKGVRTKGASGEFSSDEALLHILAGTGFTVHLARMRHGTGLHGKPCATANHQQVRYWRKWPRNPSRPRRVRPLKL